MQGQSKFQSGPKQIPYRAKTVGTEDETTWYDKPSMVGCRGLRIEVVLAPFGSMVVRNERPPFRLRLQQNTGGDQQAIVGAVLSPSPPMVMRVVPICIFYVASLFHGRSGQEKRGRSTSSYTGIDSTLVGSWDPTR